MPNFETAVRLPYNPTDYRVEAFFDDETPDDVPDLHLRIGQLHQAKGGFDYFSDVTAITVRMDLDASYDDCREFWNRLKAAADKALARLDDVEAKAGTE